jgi:hypothetical protein
LYGEYASATLERLNNENTVSKGIITSSEKSDDRLHCLRIRRLTVSCLSKDKVSFSCPDNPEKIARNRNIETILIIDSKYRYLEQILLPYLADLQSGPLIYL